MDDKTLLGYIGVFAIYMFFSVVIGLISPTRLTMRRILLALVVALFLVFPLLNLVFPEPLQLYVHAAAMPLIFAWFGSPRNSRSATISNR